ncbi:MAG TPA: DUF3352 domain-containing protein, partial [Pyrinomonadaceae bacterium]|nr:DUF3352 domain-containing protein [Pyrinomonadaceae bacterium]
MKLKSPARLTALLLAALLVLPLLVPASPAQAQRRRRRAARPARQTNTNTPPRPTTSTPRAGATPAAVAAASRAAKEAPFESLVSADAYGVVAELRNVGQLSQNDDIKTALAALRLSGEMPKEIGELLSFLNQHAETLGEARYVLTMMPAASGVPLSISALEFPTVGAAAAFEPKYRAYMTASMKAFKEAYPQPTPGARGKQPEVPKMPDFNVEMRRVGNVILIATERFTLKSLRGDGTNLLADSARFQSMRGRFASEPLFIYVDTDAVTRGFKNQMEMVQKQAEEMRAAQEAEEAAARAEDGPVMSQTQEVLRPGATVTNIGPEAQSGIVTTELATIPSETPTPETGEPEQGADGAITPLTPEEEAAANSVGVLARSGPPSEEERAAGQFWSLLRGWQGGAPRIPETFAVAVALEGGTVVARGAVANTPDGAVNLIPFLPNIFNGPPVTSESATLAPADTDVYFSTSLEWARIFNGLLAAADERAASARAGLAESREPMGSEPGQDASALMSGPIIESIEKLFGFKFREDLLPSLGNEIAFSVPLSYFTTNMMAELAKKNEKGEKDEKEAKAGFVVLIALTDTDKVRKILPRVAMAFGMAAPNAPAQTERREGFDIQSLGSFSYVIINNHLAVAEDVRAVRHVVDSFSRRQTLDSTNKFRDATSWQPTQHVAQVFVSEALMKYAQADAKKTASMSTDPVVLALAAQLDMTPEPIAYAATNEGDAMLHEVRLPLNMIKTYAASFMISVKEAPITGNESMARYALTSIVNAQERFKGEKEKARFGTLDELVKEELIDKWVFERQE